MRQFEKILGIAGAAGIISRFLLITGSKLLTVISLYLLCLLYFLFGFALFNEIPLKNVFNKRSYHGISGVRIFGSIATSLILLIVVQGIMFKVMLYPESSFFLSTGLIFLLVILIVVVVKLNSTRNIFYKKMITRIAIIGSIGFVFYLIPNAKFIEILNRKHPAWAQALINLDKDPNNKEFQAEVERQHEELLREESEKK